MPYEPLHHKYRPQTFAELVGQGAIASTLTNALRQQRIAPAYLFTGARGTGKTSSARIFAKSLNCLKSDVPTEMPCGVCDACRMITRGAALDVIEIDAASNTGVDNIRELIERAQFAPVQCRYKVYVIDEVHMLSTAAFNALLKTLEEPPDRVVFVLATTDPQKVLPTIISRCQKFDFRRIPLDAMVEHLGAIANKEAIDIAPDAIQLIAQISQGGLRDAESLLDQLSLLQGQITVERVWDLVGAVPERDLMELVRAIAQDNPATVLDKARHLMDRGREPLIVLQNLASFYRDLLIAKTAPDRSDLVAITPPTWAEMSDFVLDFDVSWILAGQKHLRASEVQLKNTSQPRLWLEVALLGLLPSALATQAVEVRELRRDAAPARAIAPPIASPNLTTAKPAVANPPQPTAAIVESAASQPAPAAQPANEPDEPDDLTVDEPEELAPTAYSTNGSHRMAETNGHTEAVEIVDDDAGADQEKLQQVWQNVLTLVQPFSTQTMLRQQCHLISFDGREARIGIKSQPLFKMAKDRMPNIEAAFSKFCNQPVKVSLEIATPTEAQAAAAELQPAIEQPTPQPNSQPSPPTKRPPTAPPASHPSPTRSDVAPNAAPPPAPAAHPQPPAPSQPPAPEPLAPPSQTGWQEEDEVTRAAKLFAPMFNGQIVSIDSTVEPIPSPDEIAIVPPTPIVEELDADDDDDVPF